MFCCCSKRNKKFRYKMFYSCDDCDAKFIFHYQLIVHRLKHNVYDENQEEICQLCDIKCINLDHLKNHVNRHVYQSTVMSEY